MSHCFSLVMVGLTAYGCGLGLAVAGEYLQWSALRQRGIEALVILAALSAVGGLLWCAVDPHPWPCG